MTFWYNLSMSDDQVKNTIAVYDTIADKYAVGMNDYAPEIERRKFSELVSPGGSILDLGCAAGRDSIYFSSKGFRTVGVDLSGKLLTIAKKKSPHLTFLQKDIRNLHFSETSFDGVWACAVLIHLTRDEMKQALKDYFRLLKYRGILFLMMKKGVGETDIAENLSSGVARHFTLFQPQEIEEAVKEAGFTLLETYTWNSNDRYTPSRDVEWISCFARK